MVLAYNEATGENEYQPILSVISKGQQNQAVTYLSIQDDHSQYIEQIVTTPGHPFYLEVNVDNTTRPEPEDYTGVSSFWVAAHDLKAGDKVRQASGGTGTVIALTTTQESQAMFNLDVAELDNYYVGDGQYLVHNCGRTIALGLGDSLDDFAKNVGGETWRSWAKADPLNWQEYFMDVMSDSSNRVFFNLDGVDVWSGVQRASSGRGGATDFELLMIKQNPQWWDRIEFISGGQPTANPFK